MANLPSLHQKKRSQKNEDEWQTLTHWFCFQKVKKKNHFKRKSLISELPNTTEQHVVREACSLGQEQNRH